MLIKFYNLLLYYICWNELIYVKVCFMNEVYDVKMYWINLKRYIWSFNCLVVEFNVVMFKIIKCVKMNKVVLCIWCISCVFCLFFLFLIEILIGGFIIIFRKLIFLCCFFFLIDVFVEVCRIKWFKNFKFSCILVFINIGGNMLIDRYINCV